MNTQCRKVFVLDFCVLKMNIPICSCYLSLGLRAWSNPSLCEIRRRCVKCVNDMENLPTEDLLFVRSWQAGTVKMKYCIGGDDERSFRPMEKSEFYKLLK